MCESVAFGPCSKLVILLLQVDMGQVWLHGVASLFAASDVAA